MRVRYYAAAPLEDGPNNPRHILTVWGTGCRFKGGQPS